MRKRRADWQRLTDVVQDELDALRWTWTDLHTKGPIGSSTVNSIKNVRYHPTRDNWGKLRILESVLGWEWGSLERILYEDLGPLRKPDPLKAYIEHVWPKLTVAARTRVQLAAEAEVVTVRMERKPREG